MDQLPLISGYYRCDDCGRTVGRVRKTRRFRLCDDCYERVIPEIETIDASMVGSPAHEAIIAYWYWYEDMEQRHPSPYRPSAGRKTAELSRSADQFYPLCECGERRQELTTRGRGGLFGGPFLEECPTCRARREVDSYARNASWLHPEWDDEDWLDLLYRVMPEAFTAGVLPDYWYALRTKTIMRRHDDGNSIQTR